jgi:hypothetical protein
MDEPFRRLMEKTSHRRAQQSRSRGVKGQGFKGKEAPQATSPKPRGSAAERQGFRLRASGLGKDGSGGSEVQGTGDNECIYVRDRYESVCNG